MRILVNGAKGQMGQIVCRLLEQNFEGHSLAAGTDGIGALTACNAVADCLVDFSHHSAIYEIITFCTSQGIPAVLAATGYTEEEKLEIKKASRQIPIFFAANMSIGIAWLCEIAKKTAAIFPNADIEIVEKHHNRKVDVPSGTALVIGKELCKTRCDSHLVIGRHEQGRKTPNEIGIHSLRLANLAGSHEVIIATDYDTITLKHEAHDRSLYAEGALAAASFLEGMEPGLYTMDDLIDERKDDFEL